MNLYLPTFFKNKTKENKSERWIKYVTNLKDNKRIKNISIFFFYYI